MTVAEDIVTAGNRSRMILMISACIFSIAALVIAGWLMFKGVRGEFTILTQYKGWTLYVASLAPGLLFLLCGTVVIIFAIRKKVSMETSHGQDKGFTKVEN